jgi:molybdopterin molybdotransferase
VNARLSINLNSLAGREDYIPVNLVESGDGFVAEPIFGRSNLIFTLTRAAGLIRIPPEVTGLEAGTDVIVELFPS